MPRAITKYQHETRSIDALRPYGKNTRLHSETQIAKLKKAVREFGWTSSMVIDENDQLLAGHCRLIVARELKMTEVPCIVVTGLSTAQKQALSIADNKLPMEASWNDDVLTETLGEISLAGLDTLLTGFEATEISNMLSPITGVFADEDIAGEDANGKKRSLTITIPNEIDVPSVAAILRKAIKTAGYKNVRVREPR